MSDTCCISCLNHVLNSNMHHTSWYPTDISYTWQRIDISTNSDGVISYLTHIWSDRCRIHGAFPVWIMSLIPTFIALHDTLHTYHIRGNTLIFLRIPMVWYVIEIRLSVMHVSLLYYVEARCQSTLVSLNCVLVRHMYRYGNMELHTGFEKIKRIVLLITKSDLLAHLYNDWSCIKQSFNAENQRLWTETRPIWSHDRTNPTRKTNRTCSSQGFRTITIPFTQCISFKEKSTVSRYTGVRRL